MADKPHVGERKQCHLLCGAQFVFQGLNVAQIQCNRRPHQAVRITERCIRRGLSRSRATEPFSKAIQILNQIRKTGLSLNPPRRSKFKAECASARWRSWIEKT